MSIQDVAPASAFESVLPAESVVAAEDQIAARYLRNVTALERDVPLVLRPGSEDEVASIVRVANERRIALYPFSTGKNWGLGSKLPVRDGCVVVDLSRMDRILHVSEDFGYAIIEPGVTQIQLARYLKEHHPSLTMNLTGSFAHTGIVGNVLERGDGMHARVEDLVGVRGVLGSGRRFQAGGAWELFPDRDHSHVSRYVAGPDLRGLFGQSALGIVTRMVFRLIHRPERQYAFWGTIADERLEAAVECVDWLARQGVIGRGGVNIGYANRFVQGAEAMAAGAGSPAAPQWNFYVLVSGTARVAEATLAEVRERLAPLSLDSGAARAGVENAAADVPDFLRPAMALLGGMPDAESIKLIYRLTETELPAEEARADADSTPFGMKCCIPVVPPRAADVRRVAEIVGRVQDRHGVNVKPSIGIDGRVLITIHFRTDDPDQVERAEACEGALWDELVGAGYWPYRAGIDQMGRLMALRPEFFALVSELKAALDPNWIIAPGRYSPVEPPVDVVARGGHGGMQ